MKDWIIERSPGGGRIRYEDAPRFAARWTTGGDPDELAAIAGPCWSDIGSGAGEDVIHIYSFEWIDSPPEQRTFERLMERAARAIDEEIAGGF